MEPGFVPNIGPHMHLLGGERFQTEVSGEGAARLGWGRENDEYRSIMQALEGTSGAKGKGK